MSGSQNLGEGLREDSGAAARGGARTFWASGKLLAAEPRPLRRELHPLRQGREGFFLRNTLPGSWLPAAVMGQCLCSLSHQTRGSASQLAQRWCPMEKTPLHIPLAPRLGPSCKWDSEDSAGPDLCRVAPASGQ